MPKTNITALTDLGFRAEQFGDPQDFEMPGGFLDRVMSDVSVIVQQAVGATTYASADATIKHRLKLAETGLAEAELWRRLDQFERSDLRVGRESGAQSTTSGSLALSNSEKAEAAGWRWIRQLTAADSAGLVHSSIAFGSSVVDPFGLSGADT